MKDQGATEDFCQLDKKKSINPLSAPVMIFGRMTKDVTLNKTKLNLPLHFCLTLSNEDVKAMGQGSGHPMFPFSIRFLCGRTLNFRGTLTER